MCHQVSLAELLLARSTISDERKKQMLDRVQKIAEEAAKTRALTAARKKASGSEGVTEDPDDMRLGS